MVKKGRGPTSRVGIAAQTKRVGGRDFVFDSSAVASLVSTIFAIFLGFWGASAINVTLTIEKHSRFVMSEPSTQMAVKLLIIIVFVSYVAYFVGRLTMAIQTMYRLEVGPGNGGLLDSILLSISRLWRVYVSFLVFLVLYNVVVLDQLVDSVFAALLVLGWFVVIIICVFKGRREEEA